MNQSIENPGNRDFTRREFVKLTFATSIAVGAGSNLWAAETQNENEIPKRALGRTGEKISAIGLGGYHIGNPPEEEGIRIIRSAIDRGINFMDNCWDYHNGGSEIRMGKALRDGSRDKIFLMTKLDGRTKDSAAKQIEESLKRLQTDRIDLMQIHEVIRMNDPERVFAKGGTMEALADAKKPGKSVSLVSPDTKIRPFICTCSKSPGKIISGSTPCKCRSTSWTRISAVFRKTSFPCSSKTKSACSE
jgi:hypothetical protein